MSRAFTLYRLQQVDTQLHFAQLRLAEIKEILTEDMAVRAAQAKVKQAEAITEAAAKDLRTAEEATRGQRIKIEQTENHLYSGKVSNPKELQDLQQEVAALRRYLETVEERQLEAMLASEDADASLKKASAHLDQVTAEKMESNAALIGEQSRLKAEVGQLESERTVALVSVSAEDRVIYDRLRAKRAGVAVAEASGQFCSACGTTLNIALYQAARSPNRLVYCDTCGRVLYAG